MNRRSTTVLVACAGVALAVTHPAMGQYSTGFETADGITASPGGTVLTGQDGYYVPSGTDYWAFTYAGNIHGIAQNPRGGDQFVAREGPGGGVFARAQRDITWPTGVVTVKYDALCLYTGQPPASNNLGSYSVQPYPGSASYIHLFSWVDPNVATNWRAFYLAYDANGIAHPQPGMSPGPAWENLTLNNWYGFETDIDFTANRITRVEITDLTTNQSSEAFPTDWYLEGGQGGGRPHPTGFRMFSGGGTVGNITAFDNMNIDEPGPPPFVVRVDGQCPGGVVFSWTGAPPNQQMAILFAYSTGSFVIPGGPCGGTQLGLGSAGLRVVHSGNTGPDGVGEVRGEVPQCGCGRFLEMVVADGSPCTTSGAVQIP